MTDQQNRRESLEESVAPIVIQTLESHFGKGFVSEVRVIPAISDHDEDWEYLRIVIVFDEGKSKLDAEWTAGLVRRLRPRLYEIDVEEFPSLCFVEKSEWPELKEKQWFGGP